eukprot:COSAG02_NODE_35854_length_462_cov_1.030303_1_plen_124_part_00
MRPDLRCIFQKLLSAQFVVETGKKIWSGERLRVTRRIPRKLRPIATHNFPLREARRPLVAPNRPLSPTPGLGRLGVVGGDGPLVPLRRTSRRFSTKGCPTRLTTDQLSAGVYCKQGGTCAKIE